MGNLIHNAATYGDDGIIGIILSGGKGTTSLDVTNGGLEIPISGIAR
jgi:hypothetical protein